MKKFEAITFGSATIDIFLTSPEFKVVKERAVLGKTAICEVYGAKIEIEKRVIGSGGGGTNTAVGLARLGLKTAAVVRTGRDFFSPIIIKDLKEAGVDCGLVARFPGEETDFSVVLVARDGGQTILVSRGKTRLEEADFDWKKIRASWFHLASLEGNLNLVEKLFQRAEQEQISVCWNPGKRELAFSQKIKKLLGKTAVLVLNQSEAESLLEAGIKEKIFWPLVFSLPVPMIAITQGKKGAWLAIPGKKTKVHQNAFPGPSVEETGAGDAFCSGLLAALFYQKTSEEALAWGLANGLAVVGRFGAKDGLLTKPEIEAMIKK